MLSFSQSSGERFGDFISPSLQNYGPRKDGVNVFIPYPAPDADGTPLATILDDGKPSDFLVEIELAEFVGVRGFHMTVVPGPNGEPHPFRVFYNAIRTHVEKHRKTVSDQWVRWLGERGEGDDKAPKSILDPPKRCILMQGDLVTQSGRPVGKNHVLFRLPPSSRVDLMNGLCPGGALEDLAEGRQLIVTPTLTERNGRMMTFYIPTPGERVDLDLDSAASRFKDWHEAVNIHEDPAKVINRLVEAFNAEAVLFAFDGHPNYGSLVSDNIREAAERDANKAAGRVVMPAPVVQAHAPVVPAAAYVEHVPKSKTTATRPRSALSVAAPQAPEEAEGVYEASEADLQDIPSDLKPDPVAERRRQLEAELAKLKG